MFRKTPLLFRFNQGFIKAACIAFLISFSSCVTQRKLEYLQDSNKDKISFKESVNPDYKLKPNDEVYVQISSLDDATAGIFANSRDQLYNIGSVSPYGASLMSYSVDKDGYLHLPFIGNILTKEKTLFMLSSILTDSLAHILNHPNVTVKLVNRYISVLGEVRNPGHFPYSQDKFTIYDAIGLAGDITDFGNRKHVLLIRNENGENIRINIDLTKSDILTSEYYNLRPNDIVYVKQVRQKFWNISQVPISLFLSTVTTALVIYSIIK